MSDTRNEPTVADILDAYKAGHIVARRWRDGSTEQYKIDAAGQAWHDNGSGVWEEVDCIPVRAPKNGTIRIIRPRTEQDVREHPIPGDVVVTPDTSYKVVYVDANHVLVECEEDGKTIGVCWPRKIFAVYNLTTVTPAHEATE
jgi:hypothetical protein